MRSAPTLDLAGISLTKRLFEVQAISFCVLIVVMSTALVEHRPLSIALEFVALLILVAAFGMARWGSFKAATHLTLLIPTLLVSALAWEDQGLRDTALLAYPGILIFSAMLEGGETFLLLLGVMTANMLGLELARRYGWFVVTLRPADFLTFVNVVGVLGGVSLGVYLLARDQRRALVRLKTENHRLQQSEAHNHFLANYDPLTGLPNRLQAQERLSQTMALAKRNGCRTALIHLDVDNFQAVNDSLGHAAGDQLLQDVALRLSQALRPTDTLCRQGGDEFLAILGDLESGEDAASVAMRITSTLEAGFLAKGMEVPVTMSMGIALYPEDGVDFQRLLQRADIAMYQAKASGRNTFRFFDSTMNTDVLENLRLASDMRPALERGEFLLHYQPQFDLATGRIVGAEALIRWQHPEFGLIPPGTFIPVAEKSGQIGEIGKWALQEACRQTRAWLDQRLNMVVSVNLSPVQFRRTDLEQSIREALERVGLPPKWIELELTESMLLADSEELTQKLANLRGMGLSLAIDDFGTGYSNLSYLQRFEVERLKVDQSFVRRLSHNPKDEAIVRAIIQMAKSLNLATVAEGIEDEATLERVKALGCDVGQGFLWSKAVPADEFVAFWEQWAVTL